ncbi:MAG: DUF4296 domain-containing protein [Bacteroidota bacterium]
MFICFAVSSGCEEQTEETAPSDLIPEGTYIQLLAEFQVLSTYTITQAGKDSVITLKENILTTYSVSDSQFVRSHRYYQNQIETQQTRIDSAISILERIKEDFNNPLSSPSDL